MSSLPLLFKKDGLIEKHQMRFEGFHSKILSMYAFGMTVRDIQGRLREMYEWTSVRR